MLDATLAAILSRGPKVKASRLDGYGYRFTYWPQLKTADLDLSASVPTQQFIHHFDLSDRQIETMTEDEFKAEVAALVARAEGK